MRHLPNIKAFSLIAEEGAISKAARRLNVSAATASSYLDVLENRLKGKLFIRTTRRLILTELGQFYLERVMPILDQLDEADRLAAVYQETPRGLLKVTTGVSIGRLILAPIIGRFTTNHPELKVYLDLSDGFRDLLRDGYDIGIRVGEEPSSNLIQRKLATVQQVLVASPDYLYCAPPLETPDDLVDHVLLLHAEQNCPPRALNFHVNGTSRTISLQGNITSNDAEMPKYWAIEGHGITQKPLWEVADAIAQKKLVRLLRDYEPEPSNLYAVSPFRSGESVRDDMFFDFLRSELRTSPLID